MHHFTTIELARLCLAFYTYRLALALARAATWMTPATHPAKPLLMWRETSNYSNIVSASLLAPLQEEGEGGGTPAPLHHQTPVTRAA